MTLEDVYYEWNERQMANRLASDNVFLPASEERKAAWMAGYRAALAWAAGQLSKGAEKVLKVEGVQP